MRSETSNKGHVQSRQHGITPEAPPRLSNGERAAMRKATNDFLKASEKRMESKVKFYPKHAAKSHLVTASFSACEGTRPNDC